MIICAGEILADMIGKEEGGIVTYERHAGGAPFNVACGLKKLGAACGFCGSVGSDLIGDFLSRFAEEQGFGFLMLGKEPDRNTTLAFVELGEGGERRFSFFRKHTADYVFPAGAAERIAAAADIAHIGSLPLSEPSGRAFADELIGQMHAAGKRVSFDVNYRDDLFAGEEEGVRTYAKYVAAADIVKFSEEELALFAQGSTAEERLRNVAAGGKTVFVTLGAAGSMVCAGGEIFRAPSVSVRPVDTTGAGDAFFAGALCALAEGEKDWEKVLRFGNVCGALATTEKGAIDAFPSRKAAEKKMEDYAK